MEREFQLAPVERMSYNMYMEKYGGTYEEFSVHCLAYMLQCRPDVDERTRINWETRLMDTRYNALREEL
jgi:hypothetical protein